MRASLSVVAERLSFIRETGGPNRGYWVEFLQRFCDGVPGDSWCADFVSFVEAVAYAGGKNPTPRTGSTDTKLQFCRRKGWIVTVPQVDDLFFYIYPSGQAHHIGIVSAITYPAVAKVSNPVIMGIAGNTSSDGKSSNGDGVYTHPISTGPSVVFVRLPK